LRRLLAAHWAFLRFSSIAPHHSPTKLSGHKPESHSQTPSIVPLCVLRSLLLNVFFGFPFCALCAFSWLKPLHHSDFGFLSDFVIRASDFPYPYLLLKFELRSELPFFFHEPAIGKGARFAVPNRALLPAGAEPRPPSRCEGCALEVARGNG
jgi:hypothetical protein